MRVRMRSADDGSQMIGGDAALKGANSVASRMSLYWTDKPQAKADRL